MLHLRNVADLLHVRCIAAGPKDDTHSRSRIDVCGCNQRSSRVVDQCSQFDGYFMLLNCFGKHFPDIVAFYIRTSPAFRPAD